MKVQKKIALGYLRSRLNLLTRISPKLAAKEAFKLFSTPPMRYGGPTLKGGEDLSFTCNGLLIHGARFNHPRPRKVMVLHGFISASGNFADYVNDLCAAGYEVLAFDAPAHGRSEGKQVNALDYKNMIMQAVELYGPVDAYIAHSFGGLALALALEEMEHTEDTRVVFIAPATETSSAIVQAFAMVGIYNNKLLNAIAGHIKQISGHDPSWFSIRRAVKHIRAKILWLHDEDDDITPISDVLPVQDDNPANIKFVFTKGLGHRKIYRTGYVKQLIYKFLQGYETEDEHAGF